MVKKSLWSVQLERIIPSLGLFGKGGIIDDDFFILRVRYYWFISDGKYLVLVLLPFFCRRTVDVEAEKKARALCTRCGIEAAMWCIECERSYCPMCWNNETHHEFVVSDEVWVNRRPVHAIPTCEHSTKGLQVHINARGQVNQGLPQRKINERLSNSRGSRRMNRMSSFPAQSTIADKGFVYAQTWDDVNGDNDDDDDTQASSPSKMSKSAVTAVDEDMTEFGGGDYIDSIHSTGGEHSAMEDSMGNGTDMGGDVSSGKRGLFVRTPSRSRTARYTCRVLSERAKSPGTLMWAAATGHESKTGGLVNVSNEWYFHDLPLHLTAYHIKWN